MKNFSAKHLAEHLALMPMLKVLLAVVAGVLLAERFMLPLWGVVAVLFLSLVAAWRMGMRALSDVYVLLAISLMAMLSVELHRRTMPSEDARLYKIKITALNSQSAGRIYGEGRVVGEYRNDSVVERNFPVRITLDSVAHLSEGSQLTAFCRIRLFNSTNASRYAHYMSQRGFVGQVWLSPKSIMRVEELPADLGQRMQQHAVTRLARLNLPADVESIAAAVTIAERLSLSPQLREEYRRSGASHLLAVSGLHVGFVVVVFNCLLALLIFLPHGQLLRRACVIVLIWLYAAVVGFSPSVVRAAAMFSILQLAMSAASYARPFNTLCLAAVLILLSNPFMIHDAGFLLSFLAVAGIVEWGGPLLRCLPKFESSPSRSSRDSFVARCCAYLLHWLLASVVVSVVASAATMPLVAWQFGLTSLWGVLLSPAMVLLCSVAVGATLVWIIAPLAPFAPLFHWVIRLSVSAMNGIAEWCASQSALIFAGHIGGVECGIIYLFYIMLTLAVWAHKKSHS